MFKKLILSGLAVMASAFLSTGAVQAQTLFEGNTFGSGTFGSTGTNVNQGLSFAGNDFSVTSATLAPGVEIAGVGSTSSLLNNLGLFTLDALTPTLIVGDTFSLAVTFTVPTITTPGGNPATFQAIVNGAVTAGTGGAQVITFAPTSAQPIAFHDGGVAGTFTLAVNNVSISPGQIAPVTGTIFANTHAVPEPGSLALLLPGLLPVGLALRRRRHSS